ncbi:hypothetical protein SAMN05421879_10126 [Ornithinimicrobium cerasi]|uniref:Uncharacterized protein n=1 Tax=Ornithinimicrobium cerasi TaxID=2248773 RepID=A0A285VAS2_9MICO|nr:hypothetical protein SAMN05421879_10126 [Ornithinimicrobium cerasi]
MTARSSRFGHIGHLHLELNVEVEVVRRDPMAVRHLKTDYLLAIGDDAGRAPFDDGDDRGVVLNAEVACI